MVYLLFFPSFSNINKLALKKKLLKVHDFQIEIEKFLKSWKLIHKTNPEEVHLGAEFNR